MKAEPIANRTFSKYCGKLRDMGLVRIEPAKVKEGNVRKFIVIQGGYPAVAKCLLFYGFGVCVSLVEKPR